MDFVRPLGPLFRPYMIWLVVSICWYSVPFLLLILNHYSTGKDWIHCTRVLDPLRSWHVSSFCTYVMILTGPVLLCTGPKLLPYSTDLCGLLLLLARALELSMVPSTMCLWLAKVITFCSCFLRMKNPTLA